MSNLLISLSAYTNRSLGSFISKASFPLRYGYILET